MTITPTGGNQTGRRNDRAKKKSREENIHESAEGMDKELDENVVRVLQFIESTSPDDDDSTNTSCQLCTRGLCM